jgi:hypothetical protein
MGQEEMCSIMEKKKNVCRNFEEKKKKRVQI